MNYNITMSQIYVFDPTANDSLSKVRGIGRYLQLLRENFPDEFTFTNNLSDINNENIFINPFFDPLKSPLTMKKVTKKQIAVIHDLIPLKYPTHFPTGIKGKINIFLNKLALKNYDLIITVSEASKKDIINLLKIKEEKIKVVHSTIPNIFFSKKETPNAEHRTPNYFIYVGDATWNKNLVNLAKAIKLANVPCIFVGKVFHQFERQAPHINGWETELYEFMKLAKDDPRFIFPGYVKDEELISLYQSAVANILVSRDEGFGFSYFEASSQAIPSILSDTPIFHETASNTALFANPEDPEDIANKIKKIYSDNLLKKKLRNEAKERLNLFSPEIFRKNFLETISGYFQM